jgi:hypothetical protein
MSGSFDGVFGGFGVSGEEKIEKDSRLFKGRFKLGSS